MPNICNVYKNVFFPPNLNYTQISLDITPTSSLRSISCVQLTPFQANHASQTVEKMADELEVVGKSERNAT